MRLTIAFVIVLSLCQSFTTEITYAQQDYNKLFGERRYDEAAELARKSLTINAKSIEAWRILGLSLQLMRKYNESQKTFSDALIIFPDNADLWFFLARVQYIQVSLKAAEQSARNAINIQQDHARAYTQLGMIFEAGYDYPKALEYYVRGVELSEKQNQLSTLPLVYTGNLLAKINRFEDAIKYFNRAALLDQNSEDIKLKIKRTREKMNTRINTASEISLIGFRNVMSSSGIDFILNNSPTSEKYLVETMTGGVGILDYDNDGWPDIYFANGAELPAMKKTSEKYWNRLYRNNRDGTFRDVTRVLGVAGEGYSMGIAVADYDNDGYQDIFVAGVNHNILLRNNGGGGFEDATNKSGLNFVDPRNGKMWAVSAAWFDYDNDGDLDLFVVNYCKWHPGIDPYCGAAKEGWRAYCFPDKYTGLPNQLFRNNGNGTFIDISEKSGIAKHIGKGMGVAVADYDKDGFTDVFVANDTLPNFLFKNMGNGTFNEVALVSGVAVNDEGNPVSSMGVDFRDYDNDGLPDLIVTALEGETYPLFRNIGKGVFSDNTWLSNLGRDTIKLSGWSNGLFDFNNDGFKDLFTANSHVNDIIGLYNAQTYKQSNSVFANLGNGTFRNVSSEAGTDFQLKKAHRGAAFADLNNDGLIDVITTSLNEPAEIFINTSKNNNHWITIHLKGARSNKDGIGSKIKITTASGIQYNHVTTSVGYASSSDHRVYFGLGKDRIIQILEITWPSGKIQILKNVGVDRVINIREEN